MGRSSSRPVPAWLETAAALAWRVLVVAAALVVLVLVLAHLTVIVVPVIGGLYLAVVLVPPARWLRNHGWPPLLATWAVFLFGIAVIVGLGFWLIPVAAHQSDPLRASLADSVNNVRNWLIHGPLHLSTSQVDRYAREVRDRLTGVGTGGSASVIGGRLLQGAAGGFHFLARFLATFALTIVTSFFFVKDGHVMSDGIARQFEPATADRLRAIGARSWTTLSGYVRGTALNGLVNAVIMAIGLSILHVPLVPAIVVLTFAGGFFPIVGAIASGGVAALVALVAQGPGTALLVVVLTVVVHHVEGYLVGPIVLGRAVRLPTIVVLLALATGGELAGVLGAFIAVPLTAVTVGIVDELRRTGPSGDGTSWVTTVPPARSEDVALPPSAPGRPR